MVAWVVFCAQAERELINSNANKHFLTNRSNGSKKFLCEIILRINAEAMPIFYKKDLKLNQEPRIKKHRT
jgi:hypothetical protein